MYGCKRNVVLPEYVEAYFVKYQIEYTEDKAGDIPTRILPDHMESYYSKYYVLTSIEGFFNQFSLIQIADLRHKQVTSLLNFFGNKVYYVGDNGKLPAGIVPLEKPKYHYTGETSVIGGLNSERIEVDTGEDQYSIFYTEDFSVRRPNISTPYRNIDFPLTDFRIQLSLLKMHLTCAEYEVKSIESEMFTIPEGYRRVSLEAMEQIINSLFTKD